MYRNYLAHEIFHFSINSDGVFMFSKLASPSQNKLITSLSSDGPLVVSVDECNFSEKVQPLYGYSPIGQNCRLRNKKGGWTSYSLVLCIASNVTKYHTILKGSVKRVDFARIVRDMPFPKGTVLLMDNCTIHKGIDDAFKAKGFTPLFLSPYSPQFQPVELPTTMAMDRRCD